MENEELSRRLFLLTVVYGRTWQTHALLLSSITTCAVYSACDYVLHQIVYFLMPFSVLPSSLLDPEVSGEEPHVYTQVLSRASAMPPPLTSLLTLQSFFSNLVGLLFFSNGIEHTITEKVLHLVLEHHCNVSLRT